MSGKENKCDSLDFIACLASHIPNKNEQMVRYTGYYSNVCRGRRKKQGACESDCVIEEDDYKGTNKSWSRLIKKIYEVDPLICPKCKGQMRIIAFIFLPILFILFGKYNNSFELISWQISYLYLGDPKQVLINLDYLL